MEGFGQASRIRKGDTLSEVISLVRVGVVGYGTMGQVHSQALQSIPGAELVLP